MNSFSKKLLIWYKQNKRTLPWRETNIPYNIWLSEIILQQTKVIQGLPYYERFLMNFPTVFDLANAKQDAVLKLWQGLGYYSRARNLHSTAREIALNYNGSFPNNYNDLLKLPGVGPYTASAIASICFNKPNAVVDGNVFRVLARHFDISKPINKHQVIKEFIELASILIDTSCPGEYNQAIMEFGALHCTPKNPKCISCPLNNSCLALLNKTIHERPKKIKANPIKNRFFHYLVPFDKHNNTFLQKREKKDIWEGLYEFPLIEANCQLDESALKIHTNNPGWLKKANWTKFQDKAIIHKLSHQSLHTTYWIIEDVDSKLAIPWEYIQDYPVPRLIERFLDKFNR
jgi:A/G-specific adenine glycosylase